MSRSRLVGLGALLASAAILVVQASGLAAAHRIDPFAGWSKSAARRAAPHVNPVSSGVQPHLATASTVMPPVQVDLAPGICVRGGTAPPGQFVVNEPAVAQSTDNRGLFAVIAQDCTASTSPAVIGGPAVFASSGGGQSWVGTPLKLQNNSASDTVIAYDPAHHVFVAAFMDQTSRAFFPDTGRIAAQTSVDGIHWTNDATLYDFQTPALESRRGTTFTNLTFGDRPYITVDTNTSSPHYGRVAVSFTIFNFNHVQNPQQHDGQGHDVGVSYTDDPTKPSNWIRRNPVNTSRNANLHGASLAFSPAGELMLVWWSGDFPVPPGTRQRQLVSELSADGGSTWGAESQVGLINDLGSPCPLTSGVTQLNTTCDSFPSLASYPPVKRADGTTPDSAFVVIWADYGSGSPQIRGKITENDGADWNKGPAPGQGFVVDCCGGTGSGTQKGAKFNPHVAIAPNGRIDIGYMSSEQSAPASGGLGTGYQYFIAEAANLDALEQGKLDTPVAVDPNVSTPASPTFVGDYSWVSSNTSTDTAAAYTSVDSGQNTHITFIRVCYPTC